MGEPGGKWLRVAALVATATGVFAGGVAVGRINPDDGQPREVAAANLQPANLQPVEPAGAAGGADAVAIGPLFQAPFTCSQHPSGQLRRLGDALGSDCMVLAVRSNGAESFPRLYRTDGAANEDWAGWRAEVLAPFAGMVEKVHVNEKTNRPGVLGDPPASSIRFLRDDGVHVLFAHVQEITVAEGDRVTAGQPVARAGNNGPAWSPHVHVGAWRDDTPLAVRFDLVAMGRQLGYQT